MKTSVIICAAGRGERAGFEKNKLLVPVNGQPVIYLTAEKFYGLTDEIIIAVSKEDESEIKAVCSPFNPIIVRGGKTRTESVYNALKVVSGEAVLIHDGARPFIAEEDIKGCIGYVERYGSAVCAAPCTDTVCTAEKGEIISVPDRANMYRLQTPQCFKTEDIRLAYSLAISDGETYTDDSSVYLKYIAPPRLYTACGENVKLTYAGDFKEFAAIKAEGADRVGFGADVHAFGKEQNFITLCGVKIPCDTGLIAHSDGDVAVHALMDAVLSAAGLKDIGNYFPDTDDKYLGADSINLLKEVVKLIKTKGYAVKNASVAIQAEKPKLAPYTESMKGNLSAALSVAPECIGISAGTCEGLGFVGKKLGISATAAVLLTQIQGR